MNNEKISGFKRNHAGGDEKLVVNKCWPYMNNTCPDTLTAVCLSQVVINSCMD